MIAFHDGHSDYFFICLVLRWSLNTLLHLLGSGWRGAASGWVGVAVSALKMSFGERDFLDSIAAAALAVVQRRGVLRSHHVAWVLKALRQSGNQWLHILDGLLLPEQAQW